MLEDLRVKITKAQLLSLFYAGVLGFTYRSSHNWAFEVTYKEARVYIRTYGPGVTFKNFIEGRGEDFIDALIANEDFEIYHC